MDDAEDRGVGADAEREGEKDDRGEAARLADAAPCVPEVQQHGIRVNPKTPFTDRIAAGESIGRQRGSKEQRKGPVTTRPFQTVPRNEALRIPAHAIAANTTQDSGMTSVAPSTATAR